MKLVRIKIRDLSDLGEITRDLIANGYVAWCEEDDGNDYVVFKAKDKEIEDCSHLTKDKNKNN